MLHTETGPIVIVVEIMGPQPDVRHTWRARFVQLTPFDKTVLAAQVRRLEVAKVATTRTIVGVG